MLAVLIKGGNHVFVVGALCKTALGVVEVSCFSNINIAVCVAALVAENYVVRRSVNLVPAQFN